MDENKKRTVLENILKSDKISSAYNRHKAGNKLNKKLIIERIMAEIDGLWARFNDIGKLNKFLESFISNHIKDFLTPRKANDLESVVGDKRVDEDPNERLKREIEERKKSKFVIPIQDEANNSGDSRDSLEKKQPVEEFINGENMAEKNETSNLESTMNRNNFPPMQQQPMQQMLPQQMQQMQQMQMLAQQPQMQQMMPNQHPLMQHPPMQQQHMQQQHMQHPPMQQQHMQHPSMQQQPMQHPPMQQQHMQHPSMQQQHMQQPPMQQQPMQQQPMQQPPMQQQPMQQMNPNMIPNQQQQQQQNRNFITKPTQVPISTSIQSMNTPSNTAAPTNTTIAPTIPVQQEQDRSVIHIDSRERNIAECPKSNPFSIYMNDGTTCLVCVRDLVTTNIHNDPYLLIQISEYTKSVYENQLNREVHFKLVRVHKDDACAYYKNTDMETMIRLRDINKVTFNILRPNGKLLYSYVNDVKEAATITEEQRVEFLDANQELRDKNVEVLQTVPDLVEVGDLVTVFEKDVEGGFEAKVIIVDRVNNRIVIEHLDDSFTNGHNKRILLHKFQVSISLEII